MKKLTIHNRMTAAVQEAAERLRQAHARLTARSGRAAPRDVYGLAGLGRFALAWAVVRIHPEHSDQCFLVPIDDYPQVGPPDVALTDGRVARCGEGAWVPIAFLPDRAREDVLAEAELDRIRAGVTALFRGQLPDDPEAQAVEDDPNYRRWMARVERARQRLQRQADEAGVVLAFRDLQPVPSETPLALAAKDGDELVGLVDEAIRQADQSLRAGRLPWPGPGELTMTANEHGAMLTWTGNEADRPSVRVPDGQAIVWTDRTTVLLPWRNGLLTLEIGSESPTTLTVVR